MTVEEIEQCLRDKMPLEKQHSLPDEMLYDSLKRIQYQYKTGSMDIEQAKKARSQAISWYEQWQRDKEQLADTIDKYTSFSTFAAMANKDGCPVCKIIAKVYDGRKKDGESKKM